MYLHIGQNILLPEHEILYIVSYPLKGANNKTFLDNLNLTSKFIRIVPENKGNSLIGTSDGKVYLSPIRTRTLKKRFP